MIFRPTCVFTIRFYRSQHVMARISSKITLSITYLASRRIPLLCRSVWQRCERVIVGLFTPQDDFSLAKIRHAGAILKLRSLTRGGRNLSFNSVSAVRLATPPYRTAFFLISFLKLEQFVYYHKMPALPMSPDQRGRVFLGSCAHGHCVQKSVNLEGKANCVH